MRQSELRVSGSITDRLSSPKLVTTILPFSGPGWGGSLAKASRSYRGICSLQAAPASSRATAVTAEKGCLQRRSAGAGGRREGAMGDWSLDTAAPDFGSAETALVAARLTHASPAGP